MQRLLLAKTISRLAARSFPARSFHLSSFAQKKIVEVVPALGESITEGEIASWCKEVGDAVAIDDVIAIVETDKVTVDIKSTHAGVLTRKIGADTISVGSELYEIDVDPAAVSAAAAAAPAITSSTPVTKADAPDSHEGRTPLIKFVGKRERVKTDVLGVAKAVAVQTPVPAAAAPVKVVKEGNGVHFTTLQGKAFFGRPALSLEEMEAIDSGVCMVDRRSRLTYD